MSAEAEQFELRPVKGPSALGGGSKRFGELLYLVSVTEFKRTYFGTVLGYVWALLRPLLLFAVLLFAVAVQLVWRARRVSRRYPDSP